MAVGYVKHPQDQGTQGRRLLRLHTPLGANVLVAERMRARECVFGMEDALDPAGSDDLCG